MMMNRQTLPCECVPVTFPTIRLRSKDVRRHLGAAFVLNNALNSCFCIGFVHLGVLLMVDLSGACDSPVKNPKLFSKQSFNWTVVLFSNICTNATFMCRGTVGPSGANQRSLEIPKGPQSPNFLLLPPAALLRTYCECGKSNKAPLQLEACFNPY